MTPDFGILLALQPCIYILKLFDTIAGHGRPLSLVCILLGRQSPRCLVRLGSLKLPVEVNVLLPLSLHHLVRPPTQGWQPQIHPNLETTHIGLFAKGNLESNGFQGSLETSYYDDSWLRLSECD